MTNLMTRRAFVSSAALAALGPGLGSRAAAKELNVDEAAIPIVDTHQHLWDLNVLRLPWFDTKDGGPLKRSFLLKDYNEATAGANVVKTVYMEVNCDPAQHDVEAGYVLKLCRAAGSRMAGAVIGGSMQSDRFRAYITQYAQEPHVKGVRMVLHDADRPKRMCLERQFVDNVRLLGRLGLSFDLCMRPAELVDGVRLVEKCPGTRFIVDHCGNRDVQSTDTNARAAWEKGVKEAAALPNVMCKISGIVVTARLNEWRPVDLAPAINFCLDAFGEDRVFFGGDWPVCTLRATYRQWLAALQTIVRERSPEFRRKLFHDNATRFYRLG